MSEVLTDPRVKPKLMNRHYHSSREGQYALNVDPQKAEWKYISFKVVNLRQGEKLEADTGSEEVVFVPLVGRGTLFLWR